jgi:hypothetical protein
LIGQFFQTSLMNFLFKSTGQELKYASTPRKTDSPVKSPREQKNDTKKKKITRNKNLYSPFKENQPEESENNITLKNLTKK